MPDHRLDNCAAPCCRVNSGLATPYQTLYEREQRASADLRRQLDETWHRLNAAVDMLREHGDTEHDLTAHAEMLANNRRSTEETNQRLGLMRLDVVALVHDAEDLRKGKGDTAVLDALLKRLRAANERAKKA